jgi:hypothetical protein
MKIIDKTPLHDENGQLSFINRIQGMLKYGMNWPAELEAQKKVLAQLDRALEKGFVLIRNFTLPNSEIVIPMILLGPGGVTVIHVTTVKGFYEAKGDQWNTVVNGSSQPASINLLNRVFRYARAVQVYMERQRIDLPAPVEPVLLAADPGAHIESMRPTARVVMSDAIKPFATSLLQARPVWRTDMAYTIADRIVDPRPPEEAAPAAAQPAAQNAASRAQAIFNASEQAQPFDMNDMGFSFEEANADAPVSTEAGPRPVRGPRAQPPGRRIFGMTTTQVTVLAVMLVCQVCILIGAAIFLMNP